MALINWNLLNQLGGTPQTAASSATLVPSQPASPSNPIPTVQYSRPAGPGQGIYGATDYYRPSPIPTPTPTPTPQPLTPTSSANTPSGPDYSAFYSQLDEMMNSLGGQSTNLQNVAREQTNQQMNTLDLQNTQNTNDLNQYQSKSLKDIGSTIASGFRAGNTILGAMGAGDSSAANQYAYALAKEGTKARGAVMADVSSRMQNLQTTYQTARNNLTSALNEKISQIAQWFSEQQNALRGQKAQVAKQQSDQAYQIALNNLSIVQQQAANATTALQNWVVNNSTTLQQAQDSLKKISASNPTSQTVNTQPTAAVASAAPQYFSSTANDTTKNSLFNNYSWFT